MEEPLPSKVYKAEEVGEMLRVHPDFVRKMMREGMIGSVKIGRFRRVTQEQLDAFMGVEKEEHTEEGRPARPVPEHREPEYRLVLHTLYSNDTSKLDPITEDDVGARIAKLIKDRKVHGFTILKEQ